MVSRPLNSFGKEHLHVDNGDNNWLISNVDFFMLIEKTFFYMLCNILDGILEQETEIKWNKMSALVHSDVSKLSF